MNTISNKIAFVLCAIALIACEQKSANDYYKEEHRLQFHFSPEANWMNDPNGMVYYDGEYHLFYQYYPDSTVWGPMHWGHAISTDLVHWEHMPIALYPDSAGYIFSGSAVVDHHNTAGFQTGEEKTLVAIYTYDKQGYETQAIAYSNDRGRSWTKYEGNPVLGNPGEQDYRDPKVFWHDATESWIMSLAVSKRIEFYRSKDLKQWEKSGEFGNAGSLIGVWECPDLFPLNVEGTDETKWILLVSVNEGSPHGGSGTQYFIGDFNGETFVSENDAESELWIDYGRDNYAGVTWSNSPDDRTLFLGWMSNWRYAQIVPTEKWRSAMTLPRELRLRNTNGNIHLVSMPVEELQVLRKNENQLAPGKPFPIRTGLVELQLEVDLNNSDAHDFGVEFINANEERLLVGYNRTTQQFYIDRYFAGKSAFSADFPGKHFAHRLSNDNMITLHIFLDHASVEVFADEGSVVLTDTFFPNEIMRNVGVFELGGKVALTKSQIFELKRIW
jgi:fructan beta-fructosidase